MTKPCETCEPSSPDDLTKLSAETLARMAIAAIYESAKKAAQPHIDRLVQLEAMKPPVLPLIDLASLTAPVYDTVPQRWTLDHRMQTDNYRSAIERVTAQLEDAERHESRAATINCADLRIIIERLTK